MAEFVNVKLNEFNMYINNITYPPAKTETMLYVQKQRANNHFVELFRCEYIKVNNSIFQKVYKYLQSNEHKYNITAREFYQKTAWLNNAVSKVIDDVYDGVCYLPDKIIQRGYAMLNEKFYEDICSLNFNVTKYIGAINLLERYLRLCLQ